MYPRDHRGIPTLPLSSPTEGPWDDCFVNREPVRIRLAGQQLSLTSSCDHWQVYDEPAHATCIEPQSGPPDAFNLDPEILEPGQVRVADFDWEWAR
jgi:aldose 1-epimerase